MSSVSQLQRNGVLINNSKHISLQPTSLGLNTSPRESSNFDQNSVSRKPKRDYLTAKSLRLDSITPSPQVETPKNFHRTPKDAIAGNR
ncbi:hypothetical protein Cob_v010380 [Colletotrichum orbiculare MAFF 240422]|uniref:Uncharacterized protein n=1 Tax=Colletotrichum orbiculare (strain 104-T / ATCC 96160 / CBS 514.97 / LARS 414 / MAFF 240422) TaxID=1213857 RepID=A0A484FE96_COLOR|nr:hypothetical protein Cob_v010380 [Colletotrichum orbiculare MAFF 240422]